MSIEEYLQDANENGKRYFDVGKIRKEIERKKMEIKLNETYIMKNGDEVEITFTDGMTSWPFMGSNGEYYSKQGKRLKIDDDASFDIQEIRHKTDKEKLATP